MNSPAGWTLLLFFFASFVGGCKSLELKSRWVDHEIVIDGKTTWWQGSSTPLDDDQTSLGVLNDGEYLYIALTSSNPAVRRKILRQGATFWFDRDGGEEREFGIRYPTGLAWGRPPQTAKGGENEREGDRENRGGSADEVEVCGPGKDENHRMTLAETGGIEARFHTANQAFVYELKVPLADKGRHPFAIETKPGALIGVGLESGATRGSMRSERESPGEEGRRGGGFGGARGVGRRGGMGGEVGGSKPEPGGDTKPLSIWAKVQLMDKNP